MPIQTYHPWQFYWIWSLLGPHLKGVHHNAYFENGIHPFPVAGPEAQRLASERYTATPYEPGIHPGEWDEYSPGRFQLKFVVDEPAPAARPKKRRGHGSG